MSGDRSFEQSTLTKLRLMSFAATLRPLCTHAKADPTYRPTNELRSRRWHVTSPRGEFEIVETGVKWFDVRERTGGGGAIDLAMHLLGLSFVDAVKHLIVHGNRHGADNS